MNGPRLCVELREGKASSSQHADVKTMVFSEKRLTLYAVLSELELDLRELVSVLIDGHKPLKELLGEPLYKKCSDRLRDNGEILKEDELFSTGKILEGSDFVDLHRLINSHSTAVPPAVAAFFKEHTNSFEAIGRIRNRIMHPRTLHVDDLDVVMKFAKLLITGKIAEWPRLKTVLDKLRREPSFVLSLEIPRSQQSAQAPFNNLPTPDFDETGFVGRTDLIELLRKKLCRGIYPVVTIIGEGAIGKSSIALQVAYEILDSSDCPFEAIIWASSKTAHLTPQEVVQIEGAITTSLGIFEHAAKELGGEGDPLAEIIEYMRAYSILLVIDNLETVLDERIKGFLGNLPGEREKRTITT